MFLLRIQKLKNIIYFGKFIDKVQHYFRPFFKTNLLLFCVLRTILALRSIANNFLGVFQRGDPPEPHPKF